MADVESKSIPHELPSSHWLKATGQCVLERYLSATMIFYGYLAQIWIVLLSFLLCKTIKLEILAGRFVFSMNNHMPCNECFQRRPVM